MKTATRTVKMMMKRTTFRAALEKAQERHVQLLRRQHPHQNYTPSPHRHSRATDGVTSASESEAKLAGVGAGILSRIQKSPCSREASSTGEAEAQQALRLATRLMSSQTSPKLIFCFFRCRSQPSPRWHVHRRDRFSRPRQIRVMKVGPTRWPLRSISSSMSKPTRLLMQTGRS